MLAKIARRAGRAGARMSASGAESASEVFEVCDEENRVVGTAARKDVHRDGLLHRAVNVLVFDSVGRLLLQKRADDKDVCPGRCAVAPSRRRAPR